MKHEKISIKWKYLPICLSLRNTSCRVMADQICYLDSFYLHDQKLRKQSRSRRQLQICPTSDRDDKDTLIHDIADEK